MSVILQEIYVSNCSKQKTHGSVEGHSHYVWNIIHKHSTLVVLPFTGSLKYISGPVKFNAIKVRSQFRSVDKILCQK